MPTAEAPTADLDTQETWEATTGGTTYVSIRDPRNPRGWVRRKIGGRANRRLTLTVEERLFNQELVAYDNKHLDPFTNGLLVRIHPVMEVEERGQFEVSDEELVALITNGTDDEFEQLIKSTDSEVILRRMLHLGERVATVWRHTALKELIAEKYPNGRQSRVVREYYEELARHAGADF